MCGSEALRKYDRKYCVRCLQNSEKQLLSYVIYLTSLLALFSIVHEPEETPIGGRMQTASIAAVTLPTDPEAPIQGDRGAAA